MTIWVLFVIAIAENRYYVKPEGFFSTMNKCFEARDLVLQSAPQPKINYEAVCIQSDRIEMQ